VRWETPEVRRQAGSRVNLRDTGDLTVFLAGAVTAVAAVAVFLLLTGGSDTAKRTRSAATGQEAAAGVRIRQTKLGPILTDGQGRTLYLFASDKNGRSHCFAACARVWPPAVTKSSTPVAGPGLSAAKLTTTRRGEKQRQLVYNGHPLYRLDADVRPGQMSGEGFLGTWWVVSPRGRRVVAPGLSTKASGGY
jgi:predicted lipoprotein with Yx(FWY)xxD motif